MWRTKIIITISVTNAPRYLVGFGKDESQDAENEFISMRPKRLKHIIQYIKTKENKAKLFKPINYIIIIINYLKIYEYY